MGGTTSKSTVESSKLEEIMTTIGKSCPSIQSLRNGQQKMYRLKIPKLEDMVTKEGPFVESCDEKGAPLSLKNFESLVVRRKKVWVIGSYKVGKSTLLNLLCGQIKFLSNDFENTKGEEFLICDEYVFVDTEGFNQPLDDEEPYVKRDFILNHLKGWCDVLIVIVDRLTIQELELLETFGDFILASRSIGRMVVLHNVKTMKSDAAMRDHVKKLYNNLQQNMSKYKFVYKESKPFEMVQYLNDYVHVQHYFVGEMYNNYMLWVDSFESLGRELRNGVPNTCEFPAAIRTTMYNLISKYFDCKDLVVTLNENSNVMVSAPNYRRLMQGDEMNFKLQSRLVPTWCAGNGRLYLILGLQEFELREVNVLDDSSITIKGHYRELQKSPIANAGLYVEILHLPCKIITEELQEIGDDKRWVYKDLGISKYGSRLLQFRMNQRTTSDLNDIPSKSRALFTPMTPDELWAKIESEHDKHVQERKEGEKPHT